MNRDDELLLSRAELYAQDRGIRILRKERLGHGSDGAVWKTSAPSAAKALYDLKNYETELECYRRLKAAGLQLVNGFNVPMLEGSNDELQVIEMSFVTPPFLLDFGKVRLDSPPSEIYDKQTLAAEESRWKFLFGGHWPDVSLALYVLQSKCGIYYLDPRPGNINCGSAGDDDLDWQKEPEIDYREYDDT